MFETIDRNNKIVRDMKKLTIPTEKVKSVKEGEAIAATLFQYLTKHTDGIGLAANQLGINKRVAVVNVTEPIYLINPEIVSVGKEIIFQEGCLSIKSKKPILTKRYDSITIKCDNYDTNMIFEADNESDTDGLLECMCVQHEIDHLDGKTILDRKYTKEPIKRGVNAPVKIGRNQKVVISDGSKSKTLKFKKAQTMLEDGWTIQEVL
jgi:peptide deformylase|tara:strand:- start:384 stop:1004 length:621 start_codon:yes stop_codon:yes gene_type:complete